MLLDKSYYEHFSSIFEENMRVIFKDNVIKISKEHDYKRRGFFRLSYKYLPYNYKIIIENEFRAFDIIIEDEEGASNVLYRIKHFDNSLDENNINKAIQILKKVLENNNFNFYFHIGDKTYRKNSDGIKRVKDLKELLNG